MREHIEKHARTGIVTNQPGGFDPNRAHAAATVYVPDQH